MERWKRDSQDALAVIVQRVCEGETLRVICKSRGWPYSVVAQWIAGSDEATKGYEQAQRLRADALASEVVEIADGAAENVPAGKLRVETRLKIAGKWDRERYGEQVQHNVSMDPFGEMLRRVSERKLAQLKALQAPGAVIDVVAVEIDAEASI